MYLTRMFINPRRHGAIHLLGSPQRIHAAVLAGFPPILDDDERVLWRLDTDTTHRVSLYIVSPHRPDLTHLADQAGWPKSDVPSWATKPYDPLLDRLKPGQRYTFRLTANPTYNAPPAGPGQRGPRRPHTTVEHQTQWLATHAEKSGFSIQPSSTAHPDTNEQALNLRLIDREKVSFTRAAGGRVTLYRVTYQGILEITDPTRLRHTLTQGIGRARAYGCGLLTLAPPNQPTA